MMSLISASMLIVIALSMAVTAILLVKALKNNFQSGQSVRTQIAKRIEQLPFGGMLNKYGVDTNSLLHQVPLTQIESEIRVCQSCVKTTECDKALTTDTTKSRDLAFCPNSQAILQQQATLS